MSRAKGDIAENKAVDFLCDNGYIIVDRNVYSRFGELDIIALKEDVLHFVEVKSGEDYEKAIQNITPSKLSKLIKTAYVYMKKEHYTGDYTFDAVVVIPDAIEFVPNITL